MCTSLQPWLKNPSRVLLYLLGISLSALILPSTFVTTIAGSLHPAKAVHPFKGQTLILIVCTQLHNLLAPCVDACKSLASSSSTPDYKECYQRYSSSRKPKRS